MEGLDDQMRRLEKIANKAHRVKPITREVNCNGCTACCRGGERVFILTECGDVPANFETELVRGVVQLAHKPNGDCVYLDRATGCTIHNRRPALCRAFDCVDFYYTTPRELREKVISPAVTLAAQSRRGTYIKK